MLPSEVKDIVARALIRWHSDGFRKWDKKMLQGLLRPRWWSYEVDEPEIQTMLKELEEEKLIRLHYKDDLYLEILDPRAYVKKYNIRLG